MDLGTVESLSLKHRQLNSDLGMVGSRATEGGEYEKPIYGRSEEQKYRRPGGYERRGDDDSDSERPKYGEEGYGRKKYVRTSDAGVMIEEREK
ncbi:unnamed protein product [Malus baccata var. baccata]